MSAETQFKVIAMMETAFCPIKEFTVQAVTSDEARDKAKHFDDVKHIISIDWIDPEEN